MTHSRAFGLTYYDGIEDGLVFARALLRDRGFVEAARALDVADAQRANRWLEAEEERRRWRREREGPRRHKP